jgi:hypothetical protein
MCKLENVQVKNVQIRKCAYVQMLEIRNCIRLINLNN